MKVAVCVSGLVKSNYLQRNNRVLKQKFPTADFYYATWNDQRNSFERNFPGEHCYYYNPPEMHYHPYMDIKDFTSSHWEETKGWIVRANKIEWSLHHTKQIIIHSWLLNELKENYDVIVRTRFDGFIWKELEANFTPFVNDTCSNQRANCFAVTNKSQFEKLYESDYVKNPKMKKWILDQLIIHPAGFVKKEEVDKLHQEGKLRAAEYGWHQVISMPYGDNHRNWHGWVNHDKNISPEFLLKA